MLSQIKREEANKLVQWIQREDDEAYQVPYFEVPCVQQQLPCAGVRAPLPVAGALLDALCCGFRGASAFPVMCRARARGAGQQGAARLLTAAVGPWLLAGLRARC